jgi:hypothetical protein
MDENPYQAPRGDKNEAPGGERPLSRHVVAMIVVGAVVLSVLVVVALWVAQVSFIPGWLN